MATPNRKAWTQSKPDKNCVHAVQGYLGSIFDPNGGAESDINNRVKLAWMKLKQLTGVLCDKKVPIKLKDKVYKTVMLGGQKDGREHIYI